MKPKGWSGVSSTWESTHPLSPFSETRIAILGKVAFRFAEKIF